jgi:hypothetical protein
VDESCVVEREGVSAKGLTTRMSGDTMLAIIAVSLTASFHHCLRHRVRSSVQRYRASRRREMEEQAWFSRPARLREGGSRGPAALRIALSTVR